MMGIVSAAADLLFPPKCIFCRRILHSSARSVCEECMEKLIISGVIRSGNYFSRCSAPLNYEGSVRDALIRYKFEDQPGYSTEFGRILAEHIRKTYSGQYDLITWIPVSAERLKKRGYDQAMLLAMATALALDDVAVETLQKQTDNPAQSSLKEASARLANVKNAYCVTEPELIAHKRILLIDDIVTTGATMDEASRMLLEAGASEVLAAALAQTPPPSEDQ